MTTEPNRVDAGVPTGGQFAAKIKSDDVPSLVRPEGEAALLGFLANRDLVRERRERLYEQKAALDRQASQMAVRGLAVTLLKRYPDAAVLRIAENENENGCYQAVKLEAADGTVLKDQADEDWLYESAVNGTEVQEFVDDLSLDDSSWMSGIATSTTRKHDFKSAAIDLRAAAAPIPYDPDQDDITKRPLSEEEQELLVKAARAGVSELEDRVGERSGDYTRQELQELSDEVDALNKLL
ncbi:hypothetical protein [Pseudarthrobacter sp. BIM B-2242]|uniref:hypothetical protein n=1 Tax=Pseudarthrobacter sp. BIM B-2242 TaxID=2772401 RepID=UPI00168AA2B7|nr:hypothetical protein [Pseudarthrobacter sp. BIM B-2242]QOD06110.1 hypothetical protein IDT60_21355 [Pseudarthrobacter sp. BIM B-2242]